MFGMGTGGSLRLLSPEILYFFRTFKTTQENLDLSVRLPYSLLILFLTAFSDQALDLLVSSTFICYHTSSDDLSTSSSLRGLTCL